jgi:LacI family transcriptional regulator
VRGFRRALLDAGLDPHRQILRHGNFAADSGYGLTRELLAQRHRPTAVLYGNDRMALGAYLALGEAGLRIPEDISVVGYDDQETLASEIQPPLTTVRLPYYEMGWWAAEQIFSGAVESLPARTYTPCRVVVRESVGRPRKGRRSASPLSMPWTTAAR